MSEEGDSSASSNTIKSFSVQVKPYSKKRPIFNPAIFGTPKRQKSASPSKSGSPYLWSQTPPKEAPSSSSVEKENESKSRDDGYYSKDGTFHKWSLSNGAHSLQRRIRMGLYNHSTDRSPRLIKTRIEKDESDFIMPSSAKEIFATLDRLTRPINRDPSHGWMSLRDAEKKPIPKPGEPGGPPVGWRTPSKWNRERVGITNMDQLRLHKSQMEARSNENVSLASQKSTSMPVQHLARRKSNDGSGGGKMQTKMTRMHESRHVIPTEIEPASYNLDTVPKLNSTPIDLTGPRSCSTPQVKSKRLTPPDTSQFDKTGDTTLDATSTVKSFSMGRFATLPPANVRYIKVNKVDGVQLFSKPKRRAESSSQESVTDSQDSQSSSFSFSQPKKITKLSLDGKRSEKPAKQWTPKKRTGDVIVKIKYPGFKSDDKLTKKAAEKSVESEKIEKKDEPEKPAASNFSAFLATQKVQSQGKWDCDVCMVKNEAAAQKCISCESPNPSAKPKPPPADPAPLPTTAGGFGDFMAKQKLGSQGKWTCDICCVQNDKDLAKCSACESPNPNAPKASAPASVAPPPATSTPLPAVSGGFSDFLNKQKSASQGKWTCDVCMIQNVPGIAKCASCETPNPNASSDSSQPSSQPPTFKFGASTTDSPAKSAEKFSFGTPTTSNFSFGATKTDTDKPEATSAPSFSFGTSKPDAKTNTAPFSFGQSAAKETTALPVVTEEPKKPMFGSSTGFTGFGSEQKKPEDDKPTFAFGAKPDTPGPSAPQFGMPEPKKPEAAAAAPTFSFSGSKGSEEKASFGASEKPFSFGSSAPSTEKAFSFGGSRNDPPKPTESEKPFSFAAKEAPADKQFAFGAGAKPVETGSKAFSFSATKNDGPKTDVDKPSFSFGGAKADAPKSDSPFSFGAKTTESSNAAAPSLFDNNKPSFSFKPSNPTTSSNSSSLFSGQSDGSFNFGKQNPAPQAAATTSIFGASTATSAEKPSTKAFSFQSSNQQSSSMFSPQNDKPGFGAPQQQPAPSFNFGGESKPATQKPFVFGDTGSQSNTGSSLFGSTASSSVAPTPAQPSIFGAATTTTTNQAPSIFGSTTNTTSNSGFNFGGGAGATSAGQTSSMFGSQPTSSSFSFGGQSNASSSNSQPTSFAPSFGQTGDQSNNMFAIQPQSSTPTAVTRRKAHAKRRNKR